MISSVQRHNKRQYEINANSLQSSYPLLNHTAVPQQCDETLIFNTPLVTIHLNIITTREKREMYSQAPIYRTKLKFLAHTPCSQKISLLNDC